MGINPTPTNHRSFTFDGKSTREFGVYITGKGVFNAPERAVEMISIPGRDGEYALDQGHFNNIEVTYRAGIVADSTTDFAEAISNFRNWLASREGYCRLTDEYNTEEYRMAVFKNAIALEHEGLLTGEFDVTFDCKPQRYLAIGEELTEIGAWGNTETAEGEIVTIEASSDTAVKALTADIEPIQDLHGYDAPWVGGAGKNKFNADRTTSSTISDLTVTTESCSVTKSGSSFIATATGVWSKLKFGISGLKENQTYTFSALFSNPSAASVGLAYYDGGYKGTVTSASTSVRLNIAFTYTSSVQFVTTLINNRSTNNGEVVTVSEIQLEEGSSVTSWQPYENICPISGHDEVDARVTGFNVWDEEWEQGGIYPSTGAPYNANNRIRSKNYIKCKPNTTYAAADPTHGDNIQLIYFDENKQFVGASACMGDSTTATTPPNCHYLKFYTGSAYGGTYNHDISINYPSTDHEYHAYNGQSYTTQLGQTVYGGTLDVVSGVLTVTHGIVDLGTLTWNYNASWGGYPAFYCSVAPTGIKVPSTTSTLIGAICSQYTEVTRDYLYSNNVTAFCISPDGKVSVRDSRYTSASDFKTAMNGVQIVYPLATPQTYQLTPQQVELLLGENNIFADSGNVTVEYGHNPTLLTNPTWFPSKPLLEVDGYGEIKFNNRSIVNIENATLGDIKQLVNESKALSMTTTFDNARFNVGDTITVDLSYFNYGAYIIMNASTTPTTSGTVTDSDAHFTTVVTDCVADQGISPSPLYVHVKTTCTPITFTLGTPDTVTNTTEAVVDTQGDKCKWTQTVKYEIDGSGNHKISIKQTLVGASGTNVTTATNMNSNPMILCNSVVAHSTLSILGNPTYIDCDIGEAYMVKDGEPISLNQYIDLGSDLPTLPSGDTEVTYDNTITKVEVKPNWWKV